MARLQRQEHRRSDASIGAFLGGKNAIARTTASSGWAAVKNLVDRLPASALSSGKNRHQAFPFGKGSNSAKAAASREWYNCY
jgi:hypothetical protein